MTHWEILLWVGSWRIIRLTHCIVVAQLVWGVRCEVWGVRLRMMLIVCCRRPGRAVSAAVWGGGGRASLPRRHAGCSCAQEAATGHPGHLAQAPGMVFYSHLKQVQVVHKKLRPGIQDIWLKHQVWSSTHTSNRFKLCTRSCDRASRTSGSSTRYGLLLTPQTGSSCAQEAATGHPGHLAQAPGMVFYSHLKQVQVVHEKLRPGIQDIWLKHQVWSSTHTSNRFKFVSILVTFQNLFFAWWQACAGSTPASPGLLMKREARESLPSSKEKILKSI